jgi:carboxymethylenebutenolidase
MLDGDVQGAMVTRKRPAPTVDNAGALMYVRRVRRGREEERFMPSMELKIRSSAGGEFDCYLAEPDIDGKVPAVVLASAVHGVDADIRGLADEFAEHGYVAAAPDLFWRSVPGPLPRGDERSARRSQPRLEKIRAGEADMADTLKHLRSHPRFNGRAAAMGFCYGGPYAILGPKRLGYAAGIACHGTQLGDFVHELDGMKKPVCIICGDQDYAAPPEVRQAYRAAQERMKNLDVHVFPGVQHGYMMTGNTKAYHPDTRQFSMQRALAILSTLR